MSLSSRSTQIGLAVTLLALALADARPAAAQDVYNQAYRGNGAGGYLWASQNAPTTGGNFATDYDDFTLTTASSITGAHWVGAYVNPPQPAPITGFTLTFYQSTGGQPGAILATEAVVGTANETALGDDLFGNPAFGYSAVFATPFAAQAGTQYWLSIVPTLEFPPQWAWESGVGGDGVSFQDFQGMRYQRPSDQTFGLTSTPEPSSVAAFAFAGLGALGLILRACRKTSPARG